MKISVIRVIAIALAMVLMIACKSSQEATQSTATAQAEGPVLLAFENGETVSQAEFERVYAKNNGGLAEAAQHSSDQYREYLDLYINFKRKVFAAEAVGLDTTAAFKQEFATYRKQLAQPYLSAKEVEDRLVREAYDRSQSLINASHLLISVGPEAAPADTLAAYQRVMSLRDSIVNQDVSFSEMAKRHSDDPSAQENAGDLGYFSVFTMVYPFESAAYATAVGEVSAPVRTQYGYHLIKVNDRISNAGEKRAAHIIIRTGERYTAKSEEEAEQKIKELHQKLGAGADFAELVEQYSDDPSSANRGGDLGTGRLLPIMEDYKLKLSEGEYSEPFQTRFGWHILKVTEVDSLDSFEEAEPELKQRISRDSRSQLSREALMRRIKTENDFKMEEETFDTWVATLPNTFVQGTWKPDSNQQAMGAKTLFSLNDEDFTATLADLYRFYQSRRLRFPRASVESAAEQVRDQFVEQELLAYEEAQLPKKNPEFRNLLQEYRDGILLFTLMEQKVWKKAVEDTLGLQKFYEENQSLFEADQMIDVREYRASDRAVIEQVETYLKEGKSPEIIDSLVNQKSTLTLRITNQTYEKGKGDLNATFFGQPVGTRSEVMEEDNFFRIMVIEETYPAGIKPFDKAKSEAITKYQDYLEATWLEELAEQYPVETNDEAFDQLFQ
jgi:peptidyl-prolyl cis-trans isomerase SurA